MIRREQVITYAAGDDDAGDDGDEGEVRDPGLTLGGHDVGEYGGEERGGGADGLVEGHGQVPERDVPRDDGAAEDEAERGDLGELDAGAHELHGHDPEPGDGGVGEERAGGHVAHGEEDGVLEAVVAEEVLVEQEHADVGGVPGGDEPHREEPPVRRGSRAARRRRGAALRRHRGWSRADLRRGEAPVGGMTDGVGWVAVELVVGLGSELVFKGGIGRRAALSVDGARTDSRRLVSSFRPLCRAHSMKLVCFVYLPSICI